MIAAKVEMRMIYFFRLFSRLITIHCRFFRKLLLPNGTPPSATVVITALMNQEEDHGENGSQNHWNCTHVWLEVVHRDDIMAILQVHSERLG